MFTRPSNREICGKVADALAALRAGQFQFGPTKHISGDLDDLGVDTADLLEVLVELLEEVQNAGPIQCYAGTRPPQRSYEPEILGGLAQCVGDGSWDFR